MKPPRSLLHLPCSSSTIFLFLLVVLLPTWTSHAFLLPPFPTASSSTSTSLVPRWAGFSPPSSTTLEQAMETIREAGVTRTVKREEVIPAMESLEATADSRRDQSKAARSSLDQVVGRWEIVYSSILGGEGYMPSFVCEIVTVQPGGGMRIDTTAFGPLPLGSMVGGYVWEEGRPGLGLGQLEFGFDNFELGPVKVGMPNKPKTYRFFYIGDEVAAARSSSGSLTILVRR